MEESALLISSDIYVPQPTAWHYYWPALLGQSKNSHKLVIAIISLELIVATITAFSSKSTIVFEAFPSYLLVGYYIFVPVAFYVCVLISGCVSIKQKGMGTKAKIRTSHSNLALAETDINLKVNMLHMETYIKEIYDNFLELERENNTLKFDVVNSQMKKLENSLTRLVPLHIKIKRYIDTICEIQEGHKLKNKASALQSLVTDLFFHSLRMMGGFFIFYYDYLKEETSPVSITKIILAAEILLLGMGNITNKIYKGYKEYQKKYKLKAGYEEEEQNGKNEKKVLLTFAQLRQIRMREKQLDSSNFNDSDSESLLTIP